MEVGIREFRAGLSIIFTFFLNAGGMMLIAGFWSFWHLLVGLLLALYWSNCGGDMSDVILITGAAGYIGSKLAERLSKRTPWWAWISANRK